MDSSFRASRPRLESFLNAEGSVEITYHVGIGAGSASKGNVIASCVSALNCRWSLMASEVVANVPRKKRTIPWLVAAVLLLLLGVCFFQLVGPDPPVIVSQQTTYIVEPLRADGMPDYERYVLDRYRKGVTPENNSAGPLLRLLFPNQVSPTDLRAIVAELGMEEAAPSKDALEVAVGETNRAVPWQWLFPRWTSEKNLLYLDAWAERTTGQAVWRPWTSDQAPPLAKWLASNKESLDLVLEASRRPRYFAPSPSLLNGRQDLLVNMVFPQRNNLLIVLTQSIREICRVLMARAMWHLGEGRPMDAWQDLHALHRLSGLLSQGLTFIERSCARDVSTMACYATATMLHHGNLTVDEARQIHNDLNRIQPVSGVAGSLEHRERIMALDALVYAGSTGDLEQLGHLDEQLGIIIELLGPKPSIDWNVVLREVNRAYDRLTGAGRIKNREARIKAMNEIESDLRAGMAASHVRELSDFVTGTFSRQERSELFANLIASDLLSSFKRGLAADDRANARLEITRLAAAIAIYRVSHDRYPEKLDELLPDILREFPRDLFHGKPFIYQRDGDGYLLYSTGENGTDDGGRYALTYFLESPPFDERGRTGRRPEDPNPEVALGGDDIAIRVPRPTFDSPKLVAPDSE
jgi:hypothetical protein